MVAVAEDGGMGEEDVVEVGVLISSSLCPCGDVANIAKRSRERERWICFNDPKAIVQISTPALSTRFSHARARTLTDVFEVEVVVQKLVLLKVGIL